MNAAQVAHAGDGNAEVGVAGAALLVSSAAHAVSYAHAVHAELAVCAGGEGPLTRDTDIGYRA